MNTLYLNESIDRIQEKGENNNHTHWHNSLQRLPLETKHSALKEEVRLNFLINSFLSISKAIMGKVQGRLCMGFKRGMWLGWGNGDIRTSDFFFIWNITVHQPTVLETCRNWKCGHEARSESDNTVMLETLGAGIRRKEGSTDLNM